MSINIELQKRDNEITRLRAENAELRKDAERYRWFRDDDLHPANWDADTCEMVRTELDAAIDAAMGEKK